MFGQETQGMNVVITDSIVRENTVPEGSTGGPAGIYIETWLIDTGVEVVIIGCQILNNEGEYFGGGLFINTGPSNATLVNNVIAGNRADDYGGGLYLYNTDFGYSGGSYTLTNNTITENINTGLDPLFIDGGGIYAEYDSTASVFNIYNNIVYGNRAPGNGADIYLYNIKGQTNLFNNNFNTSVPAGFYIDSQANFNNGDNINSDPILACTASNNHYLTASSPVIDLGKNDAPAVPSDDLDHEPRPFNGIVDIGAYEYRNLIPILPGDINDDAEVNIGDVLLGAQVLAGINPGAPVCKNADTNNDGVLDQKDMLFILQDISGLPK